MKRRTFLDIGKTVALGSMLSSVWAETLLKAGLKNIGIQLYTVRDDMNRDYVGTLKKISQIGYTHVECTGYSNGKFYGESKEHFKDLLESLGLKMWSGHTNTGFGKPDGTFSMSNRWESVCEDAAFMGQKYIGCGYFDVNERKSIDDYKRHAALFNKCGETAKKYKLTFFHHNHDFEFIPIDGVIPYDILLNETDDKLVKFELDHYWTTKAKVDSVDLINKHPGRFPLWHIKDMDNTPEQSFTEVGTGIIDYEKVFKVRGKSGNDFYYIEQDTCKNMPPLKSIEVSFNYLKNLSSK